MNIRLTGKQLIKIEDADDIYSVMQRILLREQKVDRGREHFWTISLDNAHKILNIELVSMGSAKATIVEPMEVFSIPLQKRTAELVLVHNHPAGSLTPSIADKNITDHMIQVGRILNIPILDHLIITETSYYSFANSGLLQELEKSTKYVPNYIRIQQIKKEAAEIAIRKNTSDIAKAMKAAGEPVEKIIAYTGLTVAQIKKIKVGKKTGLGGASKE